ncbi:MAG: arginine decarboxylase [Lentisphaerae bacterium]|nr:arginine decarboxylase [Lentisphaerota bacterium]
MLNELNRYRVLIVEDNFVHRSEVMRGNLNRLEASLKQRNVFVKRTYTYADAQVLSSTDMDLDCFMIASDIDSDSDRDSGALALLQQIRRYQRYAPVFLLADREYFNGMPSAELLKFSSELIWILEDSPEFIAGRILAAIERYRSNLLPPLMKAIWQYNEQQHEYSWAAPGHQGGIGFTKSPAGKKFYDFYGENLFRTDTGIERSSIGSLLDHAGAFADSEKLAAKTFGSDVSYSVIVGTSGSNRTVMQACLTPGRVAICDRNCHKSIEQGLILTGATPIYMKPSRNCYGIIGPVHRSEMTPEAIAAKLRQAGEKFDISQNIAYAVLTNCTYDGLCYNAVKTEAELSKSSDVVHFDEAWYAYARFNNMYNNCYAMRKDASKHSGATVVATHSTHKLLAALSQASYIHIRQGRNVLDFNRFNQSYLLHTTTSPLYAIPASNDIAAVMMKNNGEHLTQEVIDEAVDFRQALARLHQNFTAKGSWFFKPWNPETVTDHSTHLTYSFADAPRQLLCSDQRCWRLEPGAAWHGFSDLEENWVMLDPIKVSILSPGMSEDGKFKSSGVPAALVSAYLYKLGIVPTRTTDFQLMFLFSMGITKGKWSTLLNALVRFKELYDSNSPVSEVLPELAADYPDSYRMLGLHELGDRMYNYIRREEPNSKLNAAFNTLPQAELTPRDAFMKIVSGEVEMVPCEHLYGRITANSIIPYPPGIPMLMSGENFGDANSPQIGYLKSLLAWNRQFPGFEHITEGVEMRNDNCYVMCVK